MNYIIFDLEWNQCYNKETENPRMPFEIIEIGAVKLDNKLNIIDSFSGLIKPRLYKKLQPHIKAILNYDEATLRNGKPFDMVCRDFLKWCGDNYIFGTWGSMDISYLQNNMDYYYMNPYDKPIKYYNIQKIYSEIFDDGSSITKLEKAVSDMNITLDRPFHSAVNDAYYTAQVLRNLKPKDFADNFSYDLYNTPHSKEEEIISYHKNFLEYITRDYETKIDALNDKDLTLIRCYKCGRKVSKKIRWFANSTNSYCCIGKCWYHGYILGKIKFKQNKQGKIFAVKTLSSTNKQGLEETKARQDELRLKRQAKRQSKKNNEDSLFDDNI